jgi:hypothetical protein
MNHYPLVRCNDHELQPGYAVCVHVFAGEPIAHAIPPTDELGEALCAACAGTELTVDDLKLICARCLERVQEQRRR